MKWLHFFTYLFSSELKVCWRCHSFKKNDTWFLLMDFHKLYEVLWNSKKVLTSTRIHIPMGSKLLQAIHTLLRKWLSAISSFYFWSGEPCILNFMFSDAKNATQKHFLSVYFEVAIFWKLSSAFEIGGKRVIKLFLWRDNDSEDDDKEILFTITSHMRGHYTFVPKAVI